MRLFFSLLRFLFVHALKEKKARCLVFGKICSLAKSHFMQKVLLGRKKKIGKTLSRENLFAVDRRYTVWIHLRCIIDAELTELAAYSLS